MSTEEGGRRPRARRAPRATRPAASAPEPAAFTGPVLRPRDVAGRSFAGLRVAVLAPGREAAWVVPDLVRTADHVKVFQEGPDWLLPVPLPLPRAVVPLASRLSLRLQVRDPWLRRRLTPDARFDRRRPRIDGRFYAALQRPTCTLISWPVYAIVAQGVRSAEGIEHHVDVLVVGEESVFAPQLLAPATAPGTREDLPA